MQREEVDIDTGRVKKNMEDVQSNPKKKDESDEGKGR
jgi:hypothetical protein